MLLTKLLSAVASTLHFGWFTSSGCRQLSQISVLTDAETDNSPFARSVIDLQTSPCSIGVACGRPNATPQQYGPFHSILNNCEPNQCFVESYGQVSAYAQTNITSTSQRPDGWNNAAGRIVDLALRKVTWPHTSYMHHVSSARTERGEIAWQCMANGTSGWAQYTPSFTCATGVLDECRGAGSDAERDGMPVMVCVPAITRDFQPNTLHYEGSFKATSLGEAKKLRHNPALSGAAGSKSLTGVLARVVVVFWVMVEAL